MAEWTDIGMAESIGKEASKEIEKAFANWMTLRKLTDVGMRFGPMKVQWKHHPMDRLMEMHSESPSVSSLVRFPT